MDHVLITNHPTSPLLVVNYCVLLFLLYLFIIIFRGGGGIEVHVEEEA